MNTMLIPLVSLLLGTVIILYTLLAYTGNVALIKIPIARNQKGNLPLAIGSTLVALALMVGIFGYFNYINSTLLRYLRIACATAGTIIASYQIHRIWVTNYSFKPVKQKLITRLQPVQRYQELLSVLMSRNLKNRYRGSFLGLYWSLLNPLIMTGLYTAIFGTAFASYYNNSILNYVLAAFTGLVVINFFSASTSQALSSVVGNGALLNKIRLPVSVFPVSMVAANVFQFSFAVLPLLAIMTLVNSKSLTNVFALLLPFLSLILVSTGVGFLVSALYVFFRDLPYFYELIVFVIWISTPIFYPSAIVPKQVQPFLALNPLAPIIESLRQITLSGVFPDTILISSALLNGVIFLCFGWFCFHLWRSKFMDLL